MKNAYRILSVLCLVFATSVFGAPPAADPQPAVTVSPPKENFRDFQLYIEGLQKQGQLKEAIAAAEAKAKTLPDGWGENERWSLLLNMASRYVADSDGPQAGIDYAFKAVAGNPWAPAMFANERVYMTIAPMYIKLKQHEKAQQGIDKFLAVCATAEVPNTWWAKGFAAEGAGVAKDSVAYYTKALLVAPGRLGTARSLATWTSIERQAPTSLDLTEYYNLCRKVLASYPPPTGTVEEWTTFLSRVSFRKDSLQP